MYQQHCPTLSFQTSQPVNTFAPTLIFGTASFVILSETRMRFRLLNAIVDVRRRHKMIFWISRKLRKIATSKFTTMYPRTVLTVPQEMTSQSTSGRQQIVQTCKCGVMFGSRFLDKSSTDSEKVHSFGTSDSRASFLLMQPIRHFCSLTPKMGLELAYRRLRITQ